MNKTDQAQVVDAIRKARAELTSPNGPRPDSARSPTSATIADARAVLDLFVQRFADHLASKHDPWNFDRDLFAAACVAPLDQPMVLDADDEFDIWERGFFKTRYEQSQITVAQLAREHGLTEKHVRGVLREAGVRLGRRGKTGTPPPTAASPQADARQPHRGGEVDTTTHPAVLAHAFPALDLPAEATTVPQATTHPTSPPPSTPAARRAR
jgi:hypothetical protein